LHLPQQRGLVISLTARLAGGIRVVADWICVENTESA
jgi:hypothetical protein